MNSNICYIGQGILLNILSETNMGQQPEKKNVYMCN